MRASISDAVQPRGPLLGRRIVDRINTHRSADQPAAEGVDERGLDRLDRAYLRTIAEGYGGGPVGINAIAATLTEDLEITSGPGERGSRVAMSFAPVIEAA